MSCAYHHYQLWLCSHSDELHAKDNEHYLHTDKGSLPSTRAGLGVASHENGKEDFSEPQLDFDDDNGACSYIITLLYTMLFFS